VEPTATHPGVDQTPQNGSRSAAPRAPSGNGRKGILHEASATEHAAVPAAELNGLGFDPEEKAAELEDASAEEALRWALETFHPRMYIACSFQKTSSVTVHMANRIDADARFFYLDTDVLVPETYETKDQLVKRYGINFHRYSSITLEQQKGLYGDQLWSRDPDSCCGIRKVEPMRSALAAVDLWVSGIRRSD
jgi:3'-phosphoadenosine 5'-phosphosulfate sulfotransferase (PAPS reductase)/FAD synthetase